MKEQLSKDIIAKINVERERIINGHIAVGLKVKNGQVTKVEFASQENIIIDEIELDK